MRGRGCLDAVIFLIIRDDKVGLADGLVNNATLAVFILGRDIGDPVAYEVRELLAPRPSRVLHESIEPLHLY